ncbi:hypothetical protein D3C86_1145860 [compost metagenome]
MPARAVDGLAGLGHVAPEGEAARAHDVADGVVAAHDQAVVPAPLVGIADLDRELGELVERGLAGLGGHPGEVLEALAVDREQVRDQGLHARLGLDREVLGHVARPDGLTQGVACHADRHPPARGHGLEALQALALEAEVSLLVGLAQVLGVVVEHAAGQVGLPVRQGGLGGELGEALEVAGLHHDGAGLARHAEGLGEALPGEGGVLLGPGGARRRVVGLERVAAIDRRPVQLGQGRLEGEGLLGGNGRRWNLRQAVDLGQVGQVARAERFGLGALLEVVVPIGHAKARLGPEHDVGEGSLGVRVDAGHHGTGHADRHQVGKLARHVVEALEARDPREVGLERGEALGLDGLLVQQGGVEVADQAAVAVGAGGGRRGLEEGAHVHLGLLAQQHEGAVRALVAGDRGGVEPGAVDVAEEIVLRPDGGIAALDGLSQSGGAESGEQSDRQEGALLQVRASPTNGGTVIAPFYPPGRHRGGKKRAIQAKGRAWGKIRS